MLLRTLSLTTEYLDVLLKYLAELLHLFYLFFQIWAHIILGIGSFLLGMRAICVVFGQGARVELIAEYLKVEVLA